MKIKFGLGRRNILFTLTWLLCKIMAFLLRTCFLSIKKLDYVIGRDSGIKIREDCEDFSLHYSYIQLNSIKNQLEGHFFPKKEIKSVKEAIIDLHSGLIYNNKKVIVKDSTPWPLDHIFLNRVPSRNFPRRFVHKSNYNARVVRIHSAGFYHFLIEELPNLILLQASVPNLKILVSKFAPLYIHQALSLYCLHSEILATDYEVQRVKEVLFISAENNTGWPNYRDLQILRLEFLPKINSTKEINDAKVYISRSMSTRSPKFELELERKLSESGWIVVNLENLSFSDQVNLISKASTIMGPHGAGLSHAVWLQPGSTLIELRPQDRPHCFERMSNMLNLDYRFINLDSDNKAIQDGIPKKLESILSTLDPA